VRAFWAEFFAAMPDLRFKVEDILAEGELVAVRWSAKGTFSGNSAFQGIEPTYASLELTGNDIFVVRDGLIVREHAVTDGSDFARQIGLLPPAGSTAEQRVLKAFNGQSKLRRRAVCADPERVAEGVWLVRGGFPLKTMNVYLLEDEGGGVTMFEAGIRAMVAGLSAAAASLGGLNRIVLGHSHADHRGAAPGLGAPVYCHPAERVDAEGDGGAHYMDISNVPAPARWTIPRLLPVWDGGPVKIAGTVEEGDDVSGFKVIHIPGHAPGQIALWRESDRVALTADCFYTLDPGTGRHGAPRVPLYGFNLDTEQARASIRKIAALEPAVAWPGHADAVTGDVRAQLERAAAET
jgi:glyoxylase-like metal-dependent hydrolase (beta-lactamase superfamily II)